MTQLPLIFDFPELTARLRQSGLPRAIGVETHANRRVMISMPRPGLLRVHRGYAHAPEEVIAALVRWATARRLTRPERRMLASRFLAFPVHDFVPPVRPRQRRREPPAAGDEARLLRLRQLHREFTARWFGGELPQVEICLSGRMRRKLGHYEPASEGGPAIAISRRHIVRHGWIAAAETLLHEMVHQWQDWSRLPVDHGPAFRKKALEVGIAPRARTVIAGPAAESGAGSSTPWR
ncbi:MAG: hypothetical protein FJ206_14185 [Gemmatimonadetes bacterium]|nr:hypothetical protein [Gemmatimonadota bacterium]